MGVFRRVVAALLVPFFVVLVSGCGLFDMTGRRLTKDIQKIDGVVEAKAWVSHEKGFGDERLDVRCTFDSGLSPEELGEAIVKINALIDATGIKIHGNNFVFGDQREYKGGDTLLDPGTGILQAMVPLSAYRLGPGPTPEGSNKAAGYRLEIPSQAEDMVSFGAEVTSVLDAITDSQRSGLVGRVSVEARDVGSQDRGKFSFRLTGVMDQETADLFSRLVANPDSRIVEMDFSVSAHDNKYLVWVVADGKPDEVAQFLHSLAADSPLDVEVKASNVFGGGPWFSEVG